MTRNTMSIKYRDMKIVKKITDITEEELAAADLAGNTNAFENNYNNNNNKNEKKKKLYL